MTLQQIGEKYGTDKATYHKYCDFYEINLPKTLNRLLEVGVHRGASIRMWREYYPNTEIVGIDINTPLHIEGVTILQMNSTNLHELEKLGKFDLIIDDGSHTMCDQQIFMNYALDNMLTEHGIFIMEDLHTSKNPEEWIHRGVTKTTVQVLKELESKYNIIYFDRSGNETDSYTSIIANKKL